MATAALIALLLAWLGAGGVPSRADAPPLMVYCAAGMSAPAADVAKQYEAEYGTAVRLQFGGSGTLLSSIRAAERGDLFLAADASYIEIARDAGMVQETYPIAAIRPVVIVAAGNPRGIQGLDDLTRADLRIALANPEAASIGKQTRLMLEAMGRWTAIRDAATDHGVFKPTVNDVAGDVQLGAVDAGIVWDAVAAQFSGVEAVPIAGAAAFEQQATLGLLTVSASFERARHFARYLTARDKGLAAFAAAGFRPVEAPDWDGAARPAAR